MYVSKDTIFVHNPRAAGSSTKVALCGDREAMKYRVKPPSVHGFARDIRKQVGYTAWQEARTFAILRNPYARLVALWYFSLQWSESKGFKRIRKGINTKNYKKISKPAFVAIEKSINRSRQKFLDTKREAVRFNEFKWWVLEFCESYQWNPWFYDGRPITRIPQTEWVCDDSGDLIVDNLFTVERIGLLQPYLDEGGYGQLPHIHSERSEAQPWGAYYDEEMISFVKKHFASDLALGLWNDVDMNIILHEEGYFQGLSTVSRAREINRLINQTNSKTLLDFGCGKGHQYTKSGIQRRWGVMPFLYDPGVPQFNTLPDEVFDGVICVDVLEHIADTDIPKTLDLIFCRAKKFIYLFIATVPSQKSMPDGRNCHITIRPQDWWYDQIAMASDRAGGWDGVIEVGYNDGVG